MKRNITEKLKAWKEKKNRHPLILKGVRQAGKTYILKEFGQTFFPHYHYVNFEEDKQAGKIFQQDLNPKRILDELSFYLDSAIDIKNDLVIFDEIQSCPPALTSLKYFSEKLPQLALCSAGSLLGLYFGLSSFPVGNVDFLEMYPMSFEEFLSGIEETRSYDYLKNCRLDTQIPEIVHSRLWELLKVYFITGGLPEVVTIYHENKHDLYKALQLVRDKQNTLILGYEADMAKHSGKQNSMHINRLWRNIPSQLAREQNGSAPKFKFKDVIPGVKGYERLSGIIDWLMTAGLIIKAHIIDKALPPLSAFKEENAFKLYFFDVGILGAVSQLSPKTILDYDYGTYQGYFAENVAAQEFICSGIDELFCWREVTSEVEFLREIEGNVFPIEIKSGWVTKAKSLNVFAQKYSPEYRIVMSARNLKINVERKIHYYPLYLASRFPLPGKK
ncbi:MAG: AAA family ATPase [Candidatus Aminicenantes bacterium]|nr:AAA family ATPase [Candidatus Aminicenantes bacterium]NIM84938.1 AAA family ATPase [Candidatus Aminicenantes bacterium]NIN24452.1 AAA family ATPase [Candidatus Aminicenantes bacterium]NIN48216.1 AAA family ATPase [Candidatus Aminicenantes bacterium]NIN91119.1 AAA family ATPase [Candidatus Aminicenantes bacterium]